MIRCATLADLPELIEMGRAMQAESPRYSRLTFNADRLEETCKGLMFSDDGIVLLDVEGDTVRGAFLGFAARHFSSDEKTASDLALYVKPQYRGGRSAARLVCGYTAWADSVGARIVDVGVSTMIDLSKTVNFYERLGFRSYGVMLEAV